MISGSILNIQRFSIHDGPGIRTTVFMKGCPLRCRWCHNPESQSAGPQLIVWASRCIGCEACLAVCEEAAITVEDGRIVTDRARCTDCGACVEVCYTGAREMAGREVSVAEVVAEIERDIPFYEQSGGGATFSGGEPLMQPRFLLALLQACRARGIHTTLDTCGFASWAVVDRIRPYVDLFLYDLKVMDADRHRQLTGGSNRPVLRNLEALSRRGHRIVLRVPVIPGINDDAESMRQAAAYAASLPHLERIDLLPYHHIGAEKYRRIQQPYQLPDQAPPTAERIAEIAAAMRSFGLNVQTR
jgi:pyruvate formate lyase activating enzyme